MGLCQILNNPVFRERKEVKAESVGKKKS